MKVYEGTRSNDVVVVTVLKIDGAGHTVDRKPLDLRLDLMNHSQTGFEWGYGGSGPSQLALALCADVVGDHRARAVYQHFKWQHVCKWPMAGWRMTASQIEHDVALLEEQVARG